MRTVLRCECQHPHTRRLGHWGCRNKQTRARAAPAVFPRHCNKVPRAAAPACVIPRAGRSAAAVRMPPSDGMLPGHELLRVVVTGRRGTVCHSWSAL
jgi:hypothetical protein